MGGILGVMRAGSLAFMSERYSTRSMLLFLFPCTRRCNHDSVLFTSRMGEEGEGGVDFRRHACTLLSFHVF